MFLKAAVGKVQSAFGLINAVPFSSVPFEPLREKTGRDRGEKAYLYLFHGKSGFPTRSDTNRSVQLQKKS